jgi:hypothetical protein
VAAPPASIGLAPSVVHRGGVVVISGRAGGCPAGDTVAVLSRAFSDAHAFAGVSAVSARVRPDGRYRATTRIPPARRPGRYVVTARCGGGNLGVEAFLRVWR